MLFFAILFCGLFRTPMALSVFFTSILLMSSMYVMFVSFGLWLTEIHGLGAAGIGAKPFTIGAADLLAEIALIKVLKHYPGRKFLVVGFTFYIVTYVFWYLAWRPDVSLGVGLAAVFFCFFQFEMLVVGNLGLVGSIVLKESKIVWIHQFKAEGVLESMVFGAGATGSVIGSILSTVMWNLGPSTPGILDL